MNKTGVVEKTENNKVTVKIIRDSSCGENCAMCNACPSKDMTITIDTDDIFLKGDRVKLETNTSYVLLSAFLVYILPIIFLIIGYAVGTLYIGLMLMALSFVFLFFFDKKINTKFLIKMSKVR